MMMKMASYPYEERFRLLRQLGHPGPVTADQTSSNAFCKFATLLGSVYSGAGHEMNGAISALVQRGYSEVYHDVRTRILPVMQPQQTQRPTILHESSSDFQTHDADLPRYTTALKLYGDRRRLVVSWPTEQISMMPVKFQCAAQVEDRVFDATAGNKREAKHLASREACIALGISI